MASGAQEPREPINGHAGRPAFWCDNGNVNSSNFPNWGGNWNNTTNAGPFYWNFNYSATETNTNIGSRNSQNITLHQTMGKSPAGPASRQKITDVSNRRQPRALVPSGRSVGTRPRSL